MRLKALTILAKQHRAYWTIAPRLQEIQRFKGVWMRAAFDKGQSASETASRMRDLVQRTQSAFIGSILLTSTLYCVDILYLSRYYAGFLSISEQTYSDILLSVTGLCGIFIGLYYAAISTVGSAIYARYPISIRNLLVEERTGAVYMRLLALLGFASLLLTTIEALGGAKSLLSLLAVIAGAACAIFGFVWLGKTIFDYFDPTTLSREVYKSIIRQIKRVSHDHIASASSQVQRSAHAIASNSVLALTDMRQIVSTSGHLRDSYLQLINNMLRLLIYYGEFKGSIPYTSKWYPQKYVFHDWYRTSESVTSIHTRTGTSLQPKGIPETDWLERKIEPIVYDCLSETIRKDTFENIRLLFPDCLNYVRFHAAAGDSRKALHFSDHILGSFVDSCLANDNDSENSNWAMLADAAASLYVETIVCTRLWRVERCTSEIERICALPWGERNILKAAPRAEHYIEPICSINDQIQFEIEVEGRRITQDWFIREHISRALSKVCKEQVEGLEAAATSLRTAAERLAADRVNAAAAIYARLLEYTNKLSGYLKTFEDGQASLRSNARIKGLVWHEADFPSIRERVQALQRSLTESIATIALNLEQASVTDSPDYRGQFLDYINGELIAGLLRKDAGGFASLYRRAFLISIQKYSQLLPQSAIPEHQLSGNFAVAVSPLLDVAEIGGIGLIVSDAFAIPEIRQAIETTWNHFLQSVDKGEVRQRLMCVAIASLDAPMTLQPREIVRTGWRQELNHLLSELPARQPRRRRRAHTGFEIQEDRVVDHTSALVRAFTDAYSLFGSGITVFSNEILWSYAEHLGVDLGGSTRRLHEAVERAQAEVE